MAVNIDELSAQTDALRKDYTFLESFGVDAAKVHERSKVLQLSFTENAVEVQTFVKVYSYRTSSFQRLWRRGTARIEARNLLFFKSVGIPTPRVIAWGQRRNAIGTIVDDYIITEAIPEHSDARRIHHQCMPGSQPAALLQSARQHHRPT